jgi:hypothetical protein
VRPLSTTLPGTLLQLQIRAKFAGLYFRLA